MEMEHGDKNEDELDEKGSSEKYLFLFALRTFRRLLASFALPLLLPLLVSFIVYFAAISMLQREIGKSNETALLLMKRMVDARLNELFVAADQLSMNANVQSVAAARPPISSSRRLAMSDVQGSLRQWALANSFIDGVYLYLPQSGYVLSNFSRYNGDEFDLTAMANFDMESAAWERMVQSGGYRTLRILESTKPGIAQSFVFTQKMVSEYGAPTPAILVVQVNGRRFLDLLDSFKLSADASLAILSPQGRIVSRSGSSPLLEALDYAALQTGYRAAESGSGRSKYFVSTIGSDVSPWRYAYLVPSGTYLRSADFVKRIMLAYIAICLGGGFALSFFLARREYTPIRRLSRLFLDRLGGNELGASGDFSYLEDALQKLLKEHDNLEDLIRRQSGSMRSELLTRLLRGNVAQLSVLIDSCKACGVNLLSDNCLVMTVALSRDENRIPEREIPSETETGSLVRYMLQPVLDELLAERSAAYVVEVDGAIQCVVSLPACSAEDPEWSESIADLIGKTEIIRALFADRFGLHLSFAVSNVFDSLAALPLAAAETAEIMESIVLYDKKNVTVFAGSAVSAAGGRATIHSSLALHRLIAEGAYAGDFAAVRDNVTRFLDTELIKAHLPLQTAKLRMSGIVNIVMEALQELRPSFDGAFLDELNPMERLSRVKSVTELQRQVEDIFRSLEAHWPTRAQDQPIVLKDEVVRYVEENFRDRNLSVNAIADAFSVSVPHLSRAFKKATGVGLLDYIHIVRVREAKRLMTENRFGIQEISVMVGCGSRVTLVRAFKRYEGLAPSAFRDAET
ncbi:MAG: AraC family transcriptional regulator [Treponemataceae bacterium]